MDGQNIETPAAVFSAEWVEPGGQVHPDALCMAATSGSGFEASMGH